MSHLTPYSGLRGYVVVVAVSCPSVASWLESKLHRRLKCVRVRKSSFCLLPLLSKECNSDPPAVLLVRLCTSCRVVSFGRVCCLLHSVVRLCPGTS